MSAPVDTAVTAREARTVADSIAALSRDPHFRLIVNLVAERKANKLPVEPLWEGICDDLWAMLNR